MGKLSLNRSGCEGGILVVCGNLTLNKTVRKGGLWDDRCAPDDNKKAESGSVGVSWDTRAS